MGVGGKRNAEGRGAAAGAGLISEEPDRRDLRISCGDGFLLTCVDVPDIFAGADLRS